VPWSHGDPVHHLCTAGALPLAPGMEDRTAAPHADAKDSSVPSFLAPRTPPGTRPPRTARPELRAAAHPTPSRWQRGDQSEKGHAHRRVARVGGVANGALVRSKIRRRRQSERNEPVGPA
jgi:hypothetical protein